MRVLHTADWHLGRTIRGRSRAAEFEAVLDEVVEIARSEHVDLLLVCGDIWDAASPAPESDRLLFETLRRLIEAKIQVLLLAGNHDSSRKLEAVGRLSDLLGVYTRHEVQRPEDGGVLTIRAGSEIARIACAPWIREGRLVSAEQLVGLSPADTFSSYAEGCGEIYRALCAGFTTETVNLMAGHLFVAGSLVPGLDGSERRLDIGLTYGVPPEMLPGSPQYIALGHVHRPQEIAGAAAPVLVYLVSREFLLLVLIANIVALPVVHVLMTEWLDNFAYHADLAVRPFATSCLLSVGIAVATVSYHAARGAWLNPAETLRDE